MVKESDIKIGYSNRFGPVFSKLETIEEYYRSQSDYDVDELKQSIKQWASFFIHDIVADNYCIILYSTLAELSILLKINRSWKNKLKPNDVHIESIVFSHPEWGQFELRLGDSDTYMYSKVVPIREAIELLNHLPDFFFAFFQSNNQSIIDKTGEVFSNKR